MWLLTRDDLAPARVRQPAARRGRRGSRRRRTVRRVRRPVSGTCQRTGGGRVSSRARTEPPLDVALSRNPARLSTARACTLVEVVSARTVAAPRAVASCTTAVTASDPIPCPRTWRASQIPVSMTSVLSVRARRTEPTTRLKAATAQVDSLSGPSNPARRSRWKSRSQTTRASVQQSPSVSGGVTSLAEASVVAARTSSARTVSSISTNATRAGPPMDTAATVVALSVSRRTTGSALSRKENPLRNGVRLTIRLRAASELSVVLTVAGVRVAQRPLPVEALSRPGRCPAPAAAG